MVIKTLILALALCVPSWATVYYLSPQGSDSNTCLGPTAGQACKTPNHLNGLLHAGDVVQIRTGVFSLPTLQGVPWTPTDSGTPGNPIVWENYSADLPNLPIITGTTNPGVSLGTFTINGSPPASCVSPACTDYQVSLDANVAHNPHFVKFESLFYNGIRRSVPKQIFKNAFPNSNNANMCFAGANAAAADANMSCPAGVAGRPAPYNHCAFQSPPCSGGTPWMSFNRCMYTGTDVSGSWHNIGLGDVEISLFEIWSMSRQRLLSASGGVMNFTGATAPGSSQAGCMPGHDYIVSNVVELAQASQWYLDRCPTNPACTVPENTWTLHIYTAPGENPNVDTIYFPQMDATGDTRIIVASGLHDVSFYGITFEGDNWYPDPLGLPDFQGIPLVQAALSFTDSVNITIDSDQIYHVQGWGIEFIGTSTGITIKNSVVYDTGAGGIRIGKIGTASDTEGNIPSQVSITQNKVDYTGRIQPTGEATAIYIGDAHHVTVDHNEAIGNFSGGISNDCGLNRGALGGTTAYHCHDNVFTNNLISGQCTSGNCIGILNDFGGMYFSTNCSPNAPNCTTDPGTTKAQYAIVVEGNVIHDLAHNFTNSTAAGARGIYFDQGTSYVWADGNLVYRVGQECFFNNTPSHGNGNPAAPYLAQYNRVFNNIFALCGASSANSWRIINRGGDNLHSFTFTKNIGFFNSAVGATPQSQPGHWGCFDYSGGSPVPTSCINAWVFSSNIWFDAAHQPLDFVICTTSNCTAGQPYTHFATLPWTGEDVGSKNIDPRFVNPIFPTDNFHPTNLPALASIGFVPFEYTSAGANLNFITVPTAPSFYSSRTISASTDYITGYTPHPFSVWGNKGTGQFIVGSVTPPLPPAIATLPQQAVNPNMCDNAFVTPDVTKTIKAAGGDYVSNIAGFQLAVNDAETLRVNSNLSTKIVIDAGSVFTVPGDSSILTLPNSGYTGSKCVSIVSSNPLRRKTMVGSVEITIAIRNTNTVTVTTADAHNLSNGNHAVIEGLTGGTTDFNVSDEEGGALVTVVDGTHFTYPQTGANESATVHPHFSALRASNTLSQQVVTTPHFYNINVSGNNSSALQTAAGAHHWDLHDGEVSTTATQNDSPLILLGFEGATVRSQQAFHIGMRQFYVHGCVTGVATTIPTFPQPITGCGADTKVKNAVRWLCSDCWELDSAIDQIAYTGVESHASGTFAAAGPVRATHNFLRGGSTTLHTGGTAPTIVGLVPTGLELRQNIIAVDPNWEAISACGVVSGKGWALKNRVEFKNGSQILFDGNKVLYSWCDGQVGDMLLLTVRGNATADMVQDVTVTNNLFRHMNGWLEVLGRDDSASGSGLSMPGRRWLIDNNLVLDWANLAYSINAGSTKLVPLGGGDQDYTCTGNRNSGVTVLSACVCLDTSCPITGLATGDMVHTTACSDATFNMSRVLAVSSDPNTLGPITVLQPGQPNASGATCTLSNGQGHPSEITVSHLTAIGLGNEGSGIRNILANTANTGADPDLNVPRYITFKDSLVARNGTSSGAWFFCTGAGSKDGTSITKAGSCFDTATFAFHHLALFGTTLPTLANYTEWNPVGVSIPLNSVYIKSSAVCSGAPTSNCAGFVVDAFSATDTQYHNFKLLNTSFFHNAASDGKDFGVDLNQLDLHFVMDPYVCGSPCGTGFFPE